MALTVNSQSLFGNGPAILVVGPVQRAYADQRFSGLVGAMRTVTFGDTRKIIQQGVLIGTGYTRAEAAQAVWDLVDEIEGLNSEGTAPLAAQTNTLVDDDGVTWDNLAYDGTEFTGRLIAFQTGESSWTARMPYRTTWTQLLPAKPIIEEEEV